MPRAQLTNNASTTLASGISDVATSLTVATGAGALFPAPGANYFYATLKEGALVEIVKVTARTGDVFTVTRAQDNTTAQTFTTAATVKLSLTAAVLAELASNEDLAAKAALSAAQTFTGAQRGSVTALTSTAASIAIDLATNNNFSHTTSENTTLAAPSNPVAGQSGVITITQGATARLLAYNTFWKFPGGTVPTLTATVAAVDVFAYYIGSASRATCQLIKDVK